MAADDTEERRTVIRFDVREVREHGRTLIGIPRWQTAEAEAAKMAAKVGDVEVWKITTETIVRRVRIDTWRDGVREPGPG